MGAPPQVSLPHNINTNIPDPQTRDSGLRTQVSVRNTSRVTETGAAQLTVTSQTVHMASPSLSVSGRCEACV